jgi:hypothetical protein
MPAFLFPALLFQALLFPALLFPAFVPAYRAPIRATQRIADRTKAGGNEKKYRWNRNLR